MSKSPKKKQRPTENNAKAASDHVTHVMRIQPTRETVESVAVAVVLAFLFRSFVAEAFVIPTGSMAPTLQGQHVDVDCPECGIQYRANASGEARDGRYVVRSVCPNCRYHLELDRDKERNQRSFTGDRILVSKFAYELGDPERWDVIVFKFPGNAKQNYIKRLIGLPNELIRIRHGDIHVAKRLFTMNGMEHEALDEGRISLAVRDQFAAVGRELPENAEVVPYQTTPKSHESQLITTAWQIRDLSKGIGYEVRYRLSVDENVVTEFFAPFRIARKPAEKAMPLLQLVYDTAHQSETLKDIGWPARWRSAGGADHWKKLAENGGYEVAPTDGESMIRYRHYFPTEDQWLEIEQTGELPESTRESIHQGQLITDHYAYNDFADRAPYSSGEGHYDEPDKQGMNWVGDLAVEVDVDVAGDDGLLLFDLVEGGVHFRCQIDVATGEAKMSRSDGGLFGSGKNVTSTPTGQTRITKQREYTVRLSNVDDELRLWVDGDLIEFDVPATYVPQVEPRPRWSEQDPGDFEPAGVGTKGLAATFRRLQLYRDIYYIAVNSSQSGFETAIAWGASKRVDFYRSPDEWELPQAQDFFNGRSSVEFFVEDNCFMPLGDNSPASSDARMWDDNRGFGLDDNLGYHAYPYFERDYLIGKAILIYWPHGWRTGIKFLQIPNVKRMGLIR